MVPVDMMTERFAAIRVVGMSGEDLCEGVAGRSIIPDFWQVGVVLKPEGLLLQTSHRAWPPEGRCI